MIDKNKFFYEVTTRICGDLDLSRAALRALRFMYEIMPAEELVISLFDENKQRYRVIVHATLAESKLLDSSIALSSAAWEMLRLYDHQEIKTIDPQKDPVVSSILPIEGIAEKGCVIIPLNLESNFVGVALLVSRSGRIFSEEDLSLLSVVSKPFGIALSNSLAYLELKEQKKASDDENRALKSLLESGSTIIGRDSGLKEVCDALELVAPLESPVLLIGETGTGKGLIAKAIHAASPRCGQALIRINCGITPDNAASRALFGSDMGHTQTYCRGLERANGGTLLLAEVDALSLDAQLKLVDALHRSRTAQDGSNDVRLICTTSRNLSDMVKAGLFREDLFYSINVFPITIPPLRQRREDIPLLAEYITERKAKEMGILPRLNISSSDMELMMKYNWPGNVRELQNVIERALIMSKGDTLIIEPFLNFVAPEENLSLNDSMARAIYAALEKSGGKTSGPKGAAALLDINPSTLRSRMKKLGINRESF